MVFVWGGDGTVQRCIDAVAGTGAAVAILPAGTANLLATNLEHPAATSAEAVQVGLHGDRRRLDTGSVNGEHFAVMAGRGVRRPHDRRRRPGPEGPPGPRGLPVHRGEEPQRAPVRATVEVDGERFFKGRVSCVLAGNVGKILGGIEAFPGARPDDGLLELGVVTAKNPVEWARTFGRLALGQAEQSPFVEVTRGTKFRIRFDRKIPYELDGGARPAAGKLRIKVHPGSITICVPARLRRSRRSRSAFAGSAEGGHA